jgi:hypothetical protein
LSNKSNPTDEIQIIVEQKQCLKLESEEADESEKIELVEFCQLLDAKMKNLRQGEEVGKVKFIHNFGSFCFDFYSSKLLFSHLN